MSAEAPSVLLVTANEGFAQRVREELAADGNSAETQQAATLSRARRLLGMSTPAVILLDESFSGQESIVLLTREMVRHAPVVAAVHPAHQAALAPLISMGEVDCVAATEAFLPLVVALLERRLRWAAHSLQYEEALVADEAVDFGSLLRHELNNPLTGILGNAEMLLRHRESLSGDSSLRAETIADLAVRLRESIRRISNAWESRQRLGTGH